MINWSALINIAAKENWKKKYALPEWRKRELIETVLIEYESSPMDMKARNKALDEIMEVLK